MNTPRFIRQLIPDSSNAPAQKKIVFSSKENKEIIDSLIEDEMHISGMTGSQIIEGILINHYIPQTQCLAWIATLVHEDRDYGLYKAVSRLCIEIGSDQKLKSSYDYSTVLNLTVDALSRCSFNYASDSYNNFAYYFDSVARMFDDNSSKSNTHLKITSKI